MNARRMLDLTLIIALLVSYSVAMGSNVAGATASQPLPAAAAIQVGHASAAARPATADPPAWHSPYPAYNSIKMVSATNGWIVGGGGAIKHYYNGWGDYPSPVTSTLNAVDVSGNDGWAVGDNNTIIKLVGTDWQAVASPALTATQLADVRVVGPGEAWALGNVYYNGYLHYQPVMMHYTNTQWSLISTPVITRDVTLNKMSWVSANEGWLVGAIYEYSPSFIITPVAYHYLNGSFTSVPLDNARNVPVSVDMLNANEGWIGLAGHDTDYLLHYSGGVWSHATAHPPASPYRAAKGPIPPSISGASSTQATTKPTAPNSCFDNVGIAALIAFTTNDYYAVNAPVCKSPQQYLLWHNGAALAKLQTAALAVSGVAANDIWLVGSAATIYHWDGATLSTVSTGLSAAKVQFFSPNDGWANDGQLYHYNGANWNASGPNNVETFAFTNPNDGWVTQNSFTSYTSTVITFSHYLSPTWSATQIVSGPYQLTAMKMLSATEGWGVGQSFDSNLTSYPLAAHYSGGSWNMSQISNLSSVYMADVSFANPAEGWAVGTQLNSGYNTPLVYHYSGGNWQPVSLPVSDGIVGAVQALAPDNVWAAGAGSNGQGGYLLHWDGTQWFSTTMPTPLSAIDMFSPSEGWAGGYGGFYHYLDGSWQPVYSPAVSAVSSISFSSPTEGWAGDVFDLLHYYPACYDYYYDVPSGYWAGSSIFALSCAGVVSGTGNHLFSPGANATRIQFAKMISLARGWPIITPTTATFSDVPPSNPLYAFVETAYANGAISGATAATCSARGLAYPCFLPNDPISRAQAVLIVVRAYGWPINTTGGPHFSDVPTSNFAYGAIETCYNRGVVSGIGGGLFTPNANVTRAQIAKLLYLAMQQLPVFRRSCSKS